MPRYEQTILLKGMDTETALALAYQGFKNLQWEIMLAGQDTLLGHTPKTWKSKGQQINCSITYSSFTITSETPDSGLPGSSAIHKSNTNIFLEAFEAAKHTTGEHALSENMQAIYELRNVTQHALSRQRKEYEELDKAMNLTGSNLYVTYTIIGINVLVFLLMGIDGAGFIEPDGLVHLRWGSNFAPLTLSGDWWRLITNTFIHFGAIHIAMNMYCLYSIATYLEPLLGKQRYVTAYLCTGIVASLVSLWWHTEPTNSAGASGAVFGLYGLFLAFLTTRYIPSSIRQSLLRSIGIFVVFNLAYGMKSGVDNAAHVGGLLSGFAIGYGYMFSIKKEKQYGQKISWLLPAIAALTIGIAAIYLNRHSVDDNTRTAVQKELKESSYSDFSKFNNKLRAFDEINQSALEIMNDTTSTGSSKADRIKYQVLPKWEQAAQLIAATDSYRISPEAHKKAGMLISYINLRKRESELLKTQATSPSYKTETELKECKTKAGAIFREVVGG